MISALLRASPLLTFFLSRSAAPAVVRLGRFARCCSFLYVAIMFFFLSFFFVFFRRPPFEYCTVLFRTRSIRSTRWICGQPCSTSYTRSIRRRSIATFVHAALGFSSRLFACPSEPLRLPPHPTRSASRQAVERTEGVCFGSALAIGNVPPPPVPSPQPMLHWPACRFWLAPPTQADE